MRTLLAGAILINCFLAIFWAVAGNLGSVAFSCLCCILCWVGYIHNTDKDEQ